MNIRKDEQGFSLVEILISLVIVGTLVVSILAGYGGTLSSTAVLRNRNLAINLANERIQFLKQYELSPTYDRTSGIWLTGSPSYKNTNGIQFKVETFKDETTLFPGNNTIIPIKVEVTWLERSRQQTVSLNTYLFQSY
jgi:prepilin-type N-terminal cleavage/methylation domain-containing protein